MRGELARALEADHPKDITSVMKRSVRDGKVFIDWSQNSASKTTVAPYSLRGRLHPTVAAPRTWRELASPHLKHLDFREVLARVARRGDPMEALTEGLGELTPDRLEVYRSKRDAAITPEPVPERGADERRGAKPPIFVIQRHEASHLHHDFRLEHDGVLVSWALPKGVPTDPARNHLAVPTEDHPMSYRLFEGTIPKGEYGAGEVSIFDTGTCDFEKWRDDEVIVTLHGERDGGIGGTRRFALFRTSKEPPQWMIHLMEADPRKSTAAARTPARASPQAPRRASASAPAVYSPMLATRATKQALLRLSPSKWAFEMKWDGMRAIVEVDGEHTRLVSRSAADVTAWFPELSDVHELLDVDSAVLDGEVVAFATNGAPSFERLQRRMGLKRSSDVEQASREVKVSLLLVRCAVPERKRLPSPALHGSPSTARGHRLRIERRSRRGASGLRRLCGRGLRGVHGQPPRGNHRQAQGRSLPIRESARTTGSSTRSWRRRRSLSSDGVKATPIPRASPHCCSRFRTAMAGPMRDA